jgi:hypothetical protein
MIKARNIIGNRYRGGQRGGGGAGLEGVLTINNRSDNKHQGRRVMGQYSVVQHSVVQHSVVQHSVLRKAFALVTSWYYNDHIFRYIFRTSGQQMAPLATFCA